ncbi:MAG: hypothetical protein M3126_08585 [Candidatus Eremiobacteraeota bacterium]|nr:hypothetical protein [Candidatus Eremiobacteraeota bacterium]
MERFGSKETRLIWEGQSTKAVRRVLPSGLHWKAAGFLDRLLNTAAFKDCSNYPPGWRFKELHGRLRGTYQIRLDDKYRIRFRWDKTHGAVGITVGEFHGDDG